MKLFSLYVAVVVGGGDDAGTDNGVPQGNELGSWSAAVREMEHGADWFDYGVTKPPHQPDTLPVSTLSNSCQVPTRPKGNHDGRWKCGN
jgi:hypothetical protein